MSTTTATNKKKLKWRASATAEINRLTATETDWALPGGNAILARRTRGKQVQLPSSLLSSRSKQSISDLSSSDDSTDDEEETVGLESHTTMSSSTKKKPTNTRVLLEVPALLELVERNLSKCSICKSKLQLTMINCCLATRPRISCTNEKCCFVDYGTSPAPANLTLLPGSGSALIERTTDYAINILYVLGFIASGDGGKEAERVLGYLGLPNSTTMARRSFGDIEKRIAPAILELLEEIIQENLIKEVELTMRKETLAPDEAKFDAWKQTLNSNNNTIDPADYPTVGASTDMGWQGRGTMSQSGHAVYVGHYTRKVIAWSLYSKRCSVCQRHDKKKEPEAIVPAHDCSQNYDGSSKAMESKAVLQMYIGLYRKKQVRVGLLICDDDSSIKAKLKWSNQDHMINNNTTIVPKVISKNGKIRTRPDKGGIPGDIPQPNFGADPNHRTKLVGKEVYGLARRAKSDTYTMTEMDAYRIKHNYGYMVRSIPQLQEEQYVPAAKAVIEHHFNNHQHCGAWCRQKDLTEEEKKASKKYYRCKTKDADLYKVLRTLTDRFMTLQAMKEVAHGHDTQVNESLNNTITWHAPKNKVYSSSVSLRNRLAMAVSISSIGTLDYFTRLFRKLGISMAPDVLHYLQQKDRDRSKKIGRATTKGFKKRRLEIKYKKLEEDTKIAIRERACRDGTYQTGIGMDGGYTEEDFDDRKLDASKVCARCKQVGHKTANSKACRFYKPRTKRKATAGVKAAPLASTLEDMVARDAAEAARLDSLPFDTPMPNDEESDTEESFYDAMEEDLNFENEEADDSNPIYRAKI